jgi:hypothetical protein
MAKHSRAAIILVVIAAVAIIGGWFYYSTGFNQCPTGYTWDSTTLTCQQNTTPPPPPSKVQVALKAWNLVSGTSTVPQGGTVHLAISKGTANGTIALSYRPHNGVIAQITTNVPKLDGTGSARYNHVVGLKAKTGPMLFYVKDVASGSTASASVNIVV